MYPASPKSSSTARFAVSAQPRHRRDRACRVRKLPHQAEIVAADEREAGERALLNFGHTFAHAIETASGYGAWLHGEAVAAGIVLAATLSQRATGLSTVERERIVRLLERARLPTHPPSLMLHRWIKLMARDKKTEGGTMRFVLLKALGQATVFAGISESDPRAVLAV